MLLQVPTSAINLELMQYGVLGLAALLLGYFAWTSYKRLIDKNDKLEEKVEELQYRMNELLIEERDRMGKIIEENTRAIHDLRQIIVTTLLQQR
jgi:predicted RNA-binding protein YlqC (UPF0109 family)